MVVTRSEQIKRRMQSLFRVFGRWELGLRLMRMDLWEEKLSLLAFNSHWFETKEDVTMMVFSVVVSSLSPSMLRYAMMSKDSVVCL
ncbi:hypothetical protein RJ639_015021 [Escallonia herrerae]|uniref:Uncharacterized protein n=1 Tax=Escallonia herrerae TaxID=1293975 RepID=A0AA88VIV2_9ASTE|nr:hypothetical protein RJ639_015021 [Escallonia herrerae]